MPRHLPAGRLAERAGRIRREIVALYHELAAALDVSVVDDPLASLELTLRLPLSRTHDARPDEEPVLAALSRELHARQEDAGALQPGRALCFQCRSTDCEHARPPDARSVFFDYSATGKPLWREFTEACLSWEEPRVDQLYDDPPGVIAVARGGGELTAELMVGFGRGERAYRLLGQVACGYLPLAASVPGPPERGAVTLQVVGTRSGHEGLRLHLNAIGMEQPWTGRRGRSPDWWERRALRDAVQEARKELATLALRLDAQRRRRPIGPELRRGVEAVLGRLRGFLERQHRPQQHRTQHAMSRRLDGDRPTHTAFADADKATDDRVLFEPDRETLIVLGPKGRVHVFAEDGRHVTSLHHQRESIDHKLERKQWVPCDSARREVFREAVARLRHGGDR